MCRNSKFESAKTSAEGFSPFNLFSSCSRLHGTNTKKRKHISTSFIVILTFVFYLQQFGRAIVCSDASAEAARYGFTAVDRPEGFLVLAVASLGNEIIEAKSPPEDTKSLEERKVGVKGVGRKKTDESEHIVWKDDIKVPCGKLVPTSPEPKESILDFNEYAVYDPNQVTTQGFSQPEFSVCLFG